MKTKFHHNIEATKLKRKRLRNNPTSAEEILWGKLSKSQLGVKFRRQHSVDFYVLDFYCPECKLAVEVDGAQHLSQIDYDSYRTQYLEAFNITILRFWNSQVEKNLDWVVTQIKKHIPS